MANFVIQISRMSQVNALLTEILDSAAQEPFEGHAFAVSGFGDLPRREKLSYLSWEEVAWMNILLNIKDAIRLGRPGFRTVPVED